ncbi:glycosyltransferase [Hyphomonas sp. GM-8P]|uniref:glycosyltransferase n=1 Tax=Hyphomonas sp. GM-8P TaxID=1280945 RepID=UPI0013149A69|nr:glycosyltransferase [Hyphomonas sp. GM-8P]
MSTPIKPAFLMMCISEATLTISFLLPVETMEDRQLSTEMSAKRRVALVGPVSPYRGGVARHTTQIARTLKSNRNLDLRVISFSRLYPKFLYPGADSRDSDLQSDDSLDIEFSLDAVNPFSWLSVSRDISLWKPDLVIIPAWTFFVAPCLGAIARSIRSSGARIVLLVHNDTDHEKSIVKTTVNNFQLRVADAFICHSTAVSDSLKKVNDEAVSVVLPMPIFSDYPDAKTIPARTAELHLLFFGFIRPYKGLDTIIEALALSQREDVKLTVAGEFWDGRQTYDDLIAKHGLLDRVEIIDRYVSDVEAAGLFAQSDVVLLPYRSVTGSAVVSLAYHYLKPVVVSDLPGFRGVVLDGRTGWVIPPNDPIALSRLIDAQLSNELSRSMEPTIRMYSQTMSWTNLAASILAC